MTRDQQVEANRSAAQNLLGKIQKDPVIGSPSTQPHLGLPQNIPELADLLIEATLLPSPVNFRNDRQPNMSNFNIMKSSKFFLEALERENAQKWQNIKWRSVEEAVREAQSSQRPIFVEMIVGRLGNDI
jgi:hypothetical protein